MMLQYLLCGEEEKVTKQLVCGFVPAGHLHFHRRGKVDKRCGNSWASSIFRPGDF
jgi:hypothetical protein